VSGGILAQPFPPRCRFGRNDWPTLTAFILTPKPHAALIIVGHGSTMNPDSSAPTHEHADRIRKMGVFAEVVCCFWKEEPNMREVFEMVESDTIYIVPNFISEGYFCQDVLPRELRLEGPVTRRGSTVIYYCDPVGIHANMKRLLLQRALEIAPTAPREETSLVIVGHGTGLNENSTKAIQDQVKLIREGGYGFAEVVDAYMEQAPLVAEWDQMTSAPNVVVVPFFIADGLHSYQDIPVLLGIVEETGAALSEGGSFGGNPHALRDRQLYYSNAIGTEPLLAEVILDQIVDFDLKHGVVSEGEVKVSEIDQTIERLLEDGALQVGEVLVRRSEAGFVLCHQDDADLVETEARGGLEQWSEPEAARFIARSTAEGKFRALHSAPTLRRGWRLEVADRGALRRALDYFYPAALGMWVQHQAGRLRGTPLRDYLGRQTGMYRFSNGITDEQAHSLVAKTCGNGKCMRRILWPLNDSEVMSGAAECKTLPEAGFAQRVQARHAVALFCIEPCPFIVGAARKLARENFEAKAAATSSGSD
jgi:sirohydrochlorin cobaltochelatase